MRRKALRVEEREIMVINWFAIRIQHDNEECASMNEIANGIGMSPSSRVTMILNGMCDKQALEKLPLMRPGRWDGWGYKLKEGTFQRPQKQTIRMNFTHKGIKQMELL